MDFLDMIPDGYYVVVKNNAVNTDAGNTYPNVWKNDSTLYGSGNTLYDRLYNQGFVEVDSFNRARTWSFVYKKNDKPTFEPEYKFTAGIYDKGNMLAVITSPDTLGYVTSPPLGPAKAWKQLKWRGSIAPDVTAGDNPKIDIIGVQADNSEVTIFSGLDAGNQDYDISSIDVKLYPYVKVRMRNVDSINYTPYQLRYWRLTYVPVPEGAIAPNILLQVKDTLDVGEPLDFKVAFKNVSEAAFDSIKVKMTVTDRNNVPHVLSVPRQKNLLQDSTLNLQYTINTAEIGGLSGLNTLYVDINPDGDQPEQYHFNNFGFREIYIKPDSLKPMLDVTFDGVHILNHDIVSAKPNILVS